MNGTFNLISHATSPRLSVTCAGRRPFHAILLKRCFHTISFALQKIFKHKPTMGLKPDKKADRISRNVSTVKLF